MPKIKTGFPLADVAVEIGAELAGSQVEDRDFDLNQVLGGLTMSEPVAAGEEDELLSMKRTEIFNKIQDLPEEMVSPKLIKKTIIDTGISGVEADELYDDALMLHETTKASNVKKAKAIAENKGVEIEEKGFKETFKEAADNPKKFKTLKNLAKGLGIGYLGYAVLSTLKNTDMGEFVKQLAEDSPKGDDGKRRKRLSFEDIERLIDESHKNRENR